MSFLTSENKTLEKRTKFKLLGALGLFAGAAMLSSCVSNFCSDVEKARIAYPYEQGVTVYVDGQNAVPEEYKGLAFNPIEGNTDLWAYIPVNASGYFGAQKATYLNSNVIAYAKDNGIATPSYDYFKELDQKVLEAAISAAKADGITVNETTLKAAQLNPFSKADCVGNEEGVTENRDSILRNYGYLKFVTEKKDSSTAKTTITFDFGNWEKWNDEIEQKIETATPGSGSSSVPNEEYKTYYKKVINTLVSNVRTCITTKEGSYGQYGPSSNWSIKMEEVTWGDAWSHGLFEGLIVYPVSALMDSLSFAFDPGLSGAGQIWALIITTIIVRALVTLLTFKSTMDQQKMQALQPQIAKIQAKYPNSNTNKAEQAKVSQETMTLYKRNNINMFSSIITIFIQFPVFVSVWGALQGSAVLSSGQVLGLRLSDTISSVLSNFNGAWYANENGWWTAAILFILMAGIQFVAMKLPQWITAKRTKKIAKTSANPAADKSSKTMKNVSWVMLIMTVVMGFMLPAAMGVYWAIGGLVQMAQTAITQTIMGRKQRK